MTGHWRRFKGSNSCQTVIKWKGTGWCCDWSFSIFLYPDSFNFFRTRIFFWYVPLILYEHTWVVDYIFYRSIIIPRKHQKRTIYPSWIISCHQLNFFFVKVNLHD
jgi:hypothetical protein